MDLLRRLFGLGDATAAPRSPRRPVVAEGAVAVGPDGMTSFFSALPPAEIGGGTVMLLTWLAEADRQRMTRLPSEAYCGVLIRFGDGRPDIFIANGHFFEFIQFAIAAIGPGVEGLQRTALAAQRQGGRNVYVYDARIDAGLMANPAEMPPDEEALGLFMLQDGRITTESYRRNTRYNRWGAGGRWGEAGPTQVPLAFYSAVVARLEALARG